MTTRAVEGATFLYALARRISTRVVVFVPPARPARVLWFVAAGTDGERDELEAIGRRILAADYLDGDPLEDAAVATTVLRGNDDAALGVLVARKDGGAGWSRSEQALLDFAADFYRRPLTRCAGRPQPTRHMHVAFDSPRAGLSELESGMRSAADNGELFLLYQPEVDLRTGQIVAVEALSRWSHPQLGELGPESFIALAEESDLIQVLGAWVVEESFRDLSAWQQELPELSIKLRINVSPSQLARPGIVDSFVEALTRHGIAGDRVCIELTERRELVDVAGIVDVLARLTRVGVTSAMDDLASGYSSLGRLRVLPVDVVKLDRALVSGIDTDERAKAIVRGVVGLATELGASVIAEGVETEREIETLIALGCHSAQGHYFGRPMLARDVLTFLRDFGRARVDPPP